jgi:Flp pilus assembly protein TadG
MKTGANRARSWKRAGRVRGATTVEMTLVGIPLIFMLISIFEISRGMWLYHTAAYAVREGVRFAIVHGANCVNNPPSVNSSCTKTAADVAAVIQNAGVGLETASTTLTFTAPSPGGTPVVCTLAGAGTNCGNVWPPAASSGNVVGSAIQIDIRTPFTSALSMFWPGASQMVFGTVNLNATSTDTIQF